MKRETKKQIEGAYLKGQLHASLFEEMVPGQYSGEFQKLQREAYVLGWENVKRLKLLISKGSFL